MEDSWKEQFRRIYLKQYRRFDQFPLKDTVLKRLAHIGFDYPSPIQKYGLLPVLQGRNTVSISYQTLLNKSKGIMVSSWNGQNIHILLGNYAKFAIEI